MQEMFSQYRCTSLKIGANITMKCFVIRYFTHEEKNSVQSKLAVVSNTVTHKISQKRIFFNKLPKYYKIACVGKMYKLNSLTFF